MEKLATYRKVFCAWMGIKQKGKKGGKHLASHLEDYPYLPTYIHTYTYTYTCVRLRVRARANSLLFYDA